MRIKWFCIPFIIIHGGDMPAMMFTRMGWGNGYVIIPKSHPLYGVDYDDIPLDVHGGLTYSNRMATDDMIRAYILEKYGITKEDLDDAWVIGFDTAHAGDNSTICNREYVENETKRLAEQVENYGKEE